MHDRFRIGQHKRSAIFFYVSVQIMHWENDKLQAWKASFVSSQQLCLHRMVNWIVVTELTSYLGSQNTLPHKLTLHRLDEHEDNDSKPADHILIYIELSGTYPVLVFGVFFYCDPSARIRINFYRMGYPPNLVVQCNYTFTSPFLNLNLTWGKTPVISSLPNLPIQNREGTSE